MTDRILLVTCSRSLEGNRVARKRFEVIVDYAITEHCRDA